MFIFPPKCSFGSSAPSSLPDSLVVTEQTLEFPPFIKHNVSMGLQLMPHAKPDAGVGVSVGAVVVVREEQCSKRMSPRMTAKWKKHRQQCAIQSIPPLFRRPQHIQPKPKPQVDDTVLEDDTGGGNSTTADVLRLMDALRVPVDECMYVSLLKDCTHTRDAEQGSVVHSHIQQQKKRGSKRCVVNLSNRLLLMYAACDRHEDARQLFDGMPLRDANSWATVVSALADSGNYEESVRQFVSMLEAWGGWVAVEELDATLVFLLKVMLRACVRARVKGFGQQIHGLSLKTGATGALGGNLLRFYAATRCQGIVPLAFKRLVEGARRADRCNKNSNEASSYANILMACARMAYGRQVHADAIKVGLDGDGLVRSRLVEMYARFGVLGDARRAFEASSHTSTSDDADATCWHAMLYGYVRNGCCVEAIKLLYDMKAAGIEPKESMVRQVRNACGR